MDPATVSPHPLTQLTVSMVYEALCKLSSLGRGVSVSMASLLTYLRQNGYDDLWSGSLEKQVEAAIHSLMNTRRIITTQKDYFLPASILYAPGSPWNVNQAQVPNLVPPASDPSVLARWPKPTEPRPDEAPFRQTPDQAPFRQTPDQALFRQTPDQAMFQSIPDPRHRRSMRKGEMRAPLNFQRMQSPLGERNVWYSRIQPKAPEQRTRPSPNPFQSIRRRRAAPITHYATKETQTIVGPSKGKIRPGRPIGSATTTQSTTTPFGSTTTTGRKSSTTTGSPRSMFNTYSTASSELPKLFGPVNVSTDGFQRYVERAKGTPIETSDSDSSSQEEQGPTAQ